jgi:hypothetical protein
MQERKGKDIFRFLEIMDPMKMRADDRNQVLAKQRLDYRSRPNCVAVMNRAIERIVVERE